MPTSQARTADDIADNIRMLVDRVVDAKVTQEVAKRGQDLANLLAERGAEAGDMANEAWRDSKPMRRDAAKRLSRASNDAAKYADRTWKKQLRPLLKDLWKQRTAAASAAGAAVPAGREIVDTAAVRLGIKRREERHWAAFFLGLLIGAAAGAVFALLTAPKRGEEMRHELGARADGLATKAREEWVPLFQSGGTGNGHSGSAGEGLSQRAENLQEAAAEAGAAGGEAAEQAASDAAEAINETYESVDRETTS